MKSQIDMLVRQIHFNLNRPSAEDPQMADLQQTMGTDGVSVAGQLRALLFRWAEDPTLLEGDRSYAEHQLAGLPSF